MTIIHYFIIFVNHLGLTYERRQIIAVGTEN